VEWSGTSLLSASCFKSPSFETKKKSTVNIFAEPRKPKESKVLKLESRDGKTSLSLSQIYENEKYQRQSISRHNTQGSISSISSRASATSTNSTAQTISSGKPEPLIKGLVLKFYSETGMLPMSLIFNLFLLYPYTPHVTKT
jgi:hypothetical protein